VVPTGTPTSALPTRDFDGLVQGDGDQVLVRGTPDASGLAIGACADGARLHVDERTANGLWFALAWDPGSPPARCYAFAGHERDPRTTAYVGAALVTPLQPPPTQLAPASALATPADAATTAGGPSPTTGTPVDRTSTPTERPTPTAGPPRTPTPVPPPYSLGAEGPPSCAPTADGQFLIRWTVTEANGQALAGMSITVTGPNGQAVPAVVRAGAAPGSEVGTALVSAAGSYQLRAAMPSHDGGTATEEAVVACIAAVPPAPSPPAAGTTPSGLPAVVGTPSTGELPTTPTDPPAGQTAPAPAASLPQPARTATPSPAGTAAIPPCAPAQSPASCPTEVVDFRYTGTQIS
jgi:hypothetical protein